jgi:hypothetical protein
MIDGATSQWLGHFVASDSTVENMGVLELYLKEIWSSRSVLHRQGWIVSDGREDQAW